MIKCPKCKSNSKHRMRRKGIYKRIPGTKAYSCDQCNNYYIWVKLFRRSFSIR